MALLAGFVLLATLNSAGYRYAASDQAFYIPAILRHLDPRLFLALYLATLALLYAAGVRLAGRFRLSRWAVVALIAALTLRHAIAKTGANTLEPYFHPRELAFALGLLAVTFFLDRKWTAIGVLLIAAATLHPTTALWFVVWLAVAGWARAPRHRTAIACAVGGAGAIAALLLLRGPLSGRLTIMDADWLAAIGPKDLFPLSWPLNVWVTNLLPLPIVAFGWVRRRAAGVLVPGETALVVGAFALLVLFLCWLPFDAARVALAVQLQLSRVFWLTDVFATLYLVWLVADGSSRGPRDAAGASHVVARPSRAAIAACAIVALSLARGAYSKMVEFPDRPLFAVDVQQPDWRDAMAFARQTDPGSGWLADPFHSALYGSSLRAAGYRDVLLERMKDHAIAIYDRAAAMRVAERERALTVLAWDTPDGARALARRYGLDYLVVDKRLDLPLAHRSGSLFIYRLR